MKRDTDNIHNNDSFGESVSYWMALLTDNDPTSITSDYVDFIPDYLIVDYQNITTSSEQDDNGNGTISSTSPLVSYAAGNTPAGLKFDNDKLAIDFAADIASGNTVNVISCKRYQNVS